MTTTSIMMIVVYGIFSKIKNLRCWSDLCFILLGHLMDHVMSNNFKTNLFDGHNSQTCNYCLFLIKLRHG